MQNNRNKNLLFEITQKKGAKPMEDTDFE